MTKPPLLAALVSIGAMVPLTATHPITMAPLGTVKSGPLRGEDPRIAEINAYDPFGKRIYVVNPFDGRLDVIDARNPGAPAPAAPVDLVGSCSAAMGPSCPVLAGSEPNSVAIRWPIMAVAVANPERTSNGHAMFFWLRGDAAPLFLAAIEAGALPDMITFSESGRYVLVANEGEPNQSYTIDPPGTVTIIDLLRPFSRRGVRHVGFESFNSPAARAALEQDGVRIFGPNATVAQDLEPEYIAVDGDTAYVTLQENNAVAIIDIDSARVEKIVGLGRKDHAKPGNALDPSDQDGGINIANWPVSGLYMPDAIHAFSDRRGHSFLITANEGDAREYAAFTEGVRLNNSAYVLDPVAFPTAAALKANAALGRLNVTTGSGDTDGDGDFDRIDTFGARSISIRDTKGRLVWDSGDLFERLAATLDGTLTVFNTTSTANQRDNRSDDKGIEPEAVVVGKVSGRPYAFVGLERDSGIVVLDLSVGAAPAITGYFTNRKLPRNPATGAFLPCNDVNDCGDLGPEGLTFVPAWQSPTGKALLLVSNEVSSTTTIWQVQ
jgi:DNA-binding beta-propeller fold protein YncE